MQRRAGFPANRIERIVQTIDPTTSEQWERGVHRSWHIVHCRHDECGIADRPLELR